MAPVRTLDSFTAIEELASSLHDCPFEFDRSEFDHGGAAWRGVFLRPLWDDHDARRRRTRFFGVELSLPVVEGELVLSPVSDVTVTDDQGIGRYSVNKVTCVPAGLRLELCDAMVLEFTFTGPLAGTYEERPRPDIRALYRERLLVQRGPRIVMEG
jgi:hypothetical protein